MEIKKILCPTDFSKAANNAVEYAAKFAKKEGAELTLTHVLALPVIYDELTTNAMLSSFEQQINEEKERLKKFANETASAFNIPCTYDLEYGNIRGIKQEELAGSKSYDLIISGTNGADNIYQFYYGSNSYRISGHAETPTLIVPETCYYNDIYQLVFATEYNTGDHILISQLKEFMKNFSPSLTILHVSEKETPVSQEVFHSFCHLTDEAFGYDRKINFQRIVNQDEAAAIMEFMHTSKANVLAVCMEKHGFLYKIFHADLIKKITSYADYPVLVFHK